MRWSAFVTQDPDGAPVPGQRVRVRRLSDGETLATVTADAAGWVDVTHPGNPGRVALEVVGETYRGQDSGVHGPAGAIAGEQVCAALAALGGGVLAGEAGGGGLRVTPGGVLGSRSVTVSPGRALTAKGRPFVLYAPAAVAVPAATIGPRVDRLVIRDDHGEPGRAELLVLFGQEPAFGADPQPPAAGEGDITLALIRSEPARPTLNAGDIDETARQWAGEGAVTGHASISATAGSDATHEPAGTTFADWTGIGVTVTLAAGLEYDLSAEADLIGEGTVAARVLIGGDPGSPVEGGAGGLAPLGPRHARSLTGTGAPVAVSVQARALTAPAPAYALVRSWSVGSPQGLAYDARYGLYAGALGSRLRRYTTDGALQYETTTHYGPTVAVAVSPNGNVVTISDVPDRLDGAFAWAPNLPPGYRHAMTPAINAGGVAANANDRVFVVPSGSGPVVRYKLTAGGDFTNEVRFTGKITGARGAVAGGPSNRLYVADYDANVVKAFDGNLNLAFYFALPSSGKPRDVALDAAGYLYVTDSANKVVHRFTGGGSHVETFGAGELTEPRGVAVDGAGAVYVADYAANAIKVFAKSTPTQRLRGGTLLVTAVPRG